MKLRRSACYAKGYDPDFVKALIEGEVDAIMLDLEDGVSPANKPLARRETCRVLKEFNFNGKERVVRINDVNSEYYPLDLKEVIEPGLPDSVRLPKCDTPADVLKADADLAAIEDRAGLPRNTIELWAMIETPLGIRNAYDIATSCERVTVLTIGMEDLNRALGVERRYLHNELDLIYARQKLVLDAKAAGVQVMDTVLLVTDDEINCEYTVRSRQMGFDGRAVHNEREAAFANATYYPAPEAFDFARRVVAEYEEHEKENTPCIIDGKLICYAVYKKNKALLAMEKN